MRMSFRKRDQDVEADARNSIATRPADGSKSSTKDVPNLAPGQSAVLELQRSHGNQFVVGMLQRKCSCGGSCAKCSAERDKQGSEHGPAIADYIQRAGDGKSLNADTREAMESRLGNDFSDVRVHSDEEAAGAASALNAEAFTVGKDVFFGAGKYRGDSADPLLAHELTHVAQQRGGAASGSGSELEAQAEQAERTVRGEPGKVAISSAPRGIQRKAADDTATVDTPTQPKKPARHPSFLERVGHALGAAGSLVARGARAVGHAVETAAGAVWTGLRWVGKQLWSKVTGVYERVMHWITRLPARVGRLLNGLWEGVKSVQPWALSWWESLGHADTWIDFLQWLGRNIIYLAEVAGIPEIAETLNDFIKFNTRALSGSETSIAENVFGTSIDLGLVRVDEHAVLGPAFTGRAYTAFHTISNWGALPAATLVHELTHVWQYQQSGAIYMAQAIHAQMQFGSAAYDFDVHELRSAKHDGRNILSFNREKQAQIVEDFYRIKNGQPVFHSDGTHDDLHLYAYFVQAVSSHSLAELAGD